MEENPRELPPKLSELLPFFIQRVMRGLANAPSKSDAVVCTTH